MVPRLKTQYFKKVQGDLAKKHSLKNLNQIPVLEKIVVNVGLSEAKENSKALQKVMEEMALITGQKAIITRAKKSIASFKIRKGVPVGCKVTLHGDKMWEFFDRLVNVTLPRVRDFRGLDSKSFDRYNNYTIGIKEQLVFPEIDYDKVEKIHGLDITIVVKNSKRREIVKDFLTMMGMPFKN
ncbi:MAG: 50S ribosomal protein L5 [Spirochaetes bacterium]|nr:50S ribosomal protein L5 [Spirochaetota bacterium]